VAKSLTHPRQTSMKGRCQELIAPVGATSSTYRGRRPLPDASEAMDTPIIDHRAPPPEFAKARHADCLDGHQAPFQDTPSGDHPYTATHRDMRKRRCQHDFAPATVLMVRDRASLPCSGRLRQPSSAFVPELIKTDCASAPESDVIASKDPARNKTGESRPVRVLTPRDRDALPLPDRRIRQAIPIGRTRRVPVDTIPHRHRRHRHDECRDRRRLPVLPTVGERPQKGPDDAAPEVAFNAVSDQGAWPAEPDRRRPDTPRLGLG